MTVSRGTEWAAPLTLDFDGRAHTGGAHLRSRLPAAWAATRRMSWTHELRAARQAPGSILIPSIPQRSSEGPRGLGPRNGEERVLTKRRCTSFFWAAATELKLSYHNPETPLFIVYLHYPAPPNYPLRYPKYHLMVTMRLLVERHCGMLAGNLNQGL